MAQEPTTDSKDNTNNDLNKALSVPKQPHWHSHESSLSFQSQSQLKEYLKDKCMLFYCESMKEIAIEIQKKSNGATLLGDIEWDLFKDGFPNLKIKKAFHVRWCHVAFLADLSDPRNIFEQYAIMCALPRYLAKSVKIFVGYFPTGTMERVEEYGRVATAKTLA
eukprot:988990_1